jgi:hypothetical protein
MDAPPLLLLLHARHHGPNLSVIGSQAPPPSTKLPSSPSVPRVPGPGSSATSRPSKESRAGRRTGRGIKKSEMHHKSSANARRPWFNCQLLLVHLAPELGSAFSWIFELGRRVPRGIVGFDLRFVGPDLASVH